MEAEQYCSLTVHDIVIDLGVELISVISLGIPISETENITFSILALHKP